MFVVPTVGILWTYGAQKGPKQRFRAFRLKKTGAPKMLPDQSLGRLACCFDFQPA